MKILQVIPNLAPSSGGPVNAVMGLSYALAKNNQDVTVFTTNADVKGSLDVPLEMPVNIKNVEVFYYPVQYLKHYKFSLPLVKALKKNIPLFDIIHIHSLFQFSTLVASYYCQRHNKPYIIRPLGQLDPFVLKRHYIYKRAYLSLFDSNNLKKATAVHFTTDEEKRLAERLGINLRSFVIPLGLDLEEFTNLPEYGTFRSGYPELRNKKIILFLSRISFKKGLDILVKAFAGVARERGDVALVIVGPDDEGYGARVKKWLRKEGVLDRTIFTGMLLGKDKLAAFRDSDIFVLPSYSENFAMATVEAMACGLPVIISHKIGIYKEVYKHNAGLVIDCNAKSLLQGIKSILENKNYAKEMSFNAKNLVRDYFNINKVVFKMIDFYEEAIKKYNS